MQLMDKTKQQLEKELKMKSKNPFIANNNIKLGTYYLSKLLKDFDGDLIRVIASYNAGPHNVRKWNKIHIQKRDQIFDGINENSWMYFVHSYKYDLDNNITLSKSHYGQEFSSSICNDNIYATQFHPEKSNVDGLKVLDNFAKLVN